MVSERKFQCNCADGKTVVVTKRQENKDRKDEGEGGDRLPNALSIKKIRHRPRPYRP